MNGAIIREYSTARTGSRISRSPHLGRNNLPPQLEAWLIDPITHTCKRDIATLAVELGPNGSFYARDTNSYRWHNLPDALEEAIQQRLCPAGWTARPDFVVLGADGAFVYSNDCGGASHALGNYPKLQDLILGLQRANVGGLTGFGLVQVRPSILDSACTEFSVSGFQCRSISLAILSLSIIQATTSRSSPRVRRKL